MRKKKFNLPVKMIVFLAIILLAISFIIGYIWKILTTAEFFAVKRVIVRNSNVQLDYLKGRNIFGLDLNAESGRAILTCPDCRKVRLARIIPDCIFVDFIKRKPLAWIRFYKDFAIDEHGVLFLPDPAVEETELPVVYGLETKIFAPKAGVKYSRPELNLALDIAKEFRATKVFRDFTLKRINVSSLQNAGFFVLFPKQALGYSKPNLGFEQRGFEVRIGATDIKKKMMILGGLIMQAAKEWNNINYIDLRFKEPVIKFNNVK